MIVDSIRTGIVFGIYLSMIILFMWYVCVYNWYRRSDARLRDLVLSKYAGFHSDALKPNYMFYIDQFQYDEPNDIITAVIKQKHREDQSTDPSFSDTIRYTIANSCSIINLACLEV